MPSVLLLALVAWIAIAVGGAIVVGAGAYFIGKALFGPGPTPIGAGGTVDLRAINGTGGTALPPAAPAATVTPNPFPTRINKAGTVVTVTTKDVNGNAIADVAIDVKLEVGTDNVQTSILDFGPKPAGGSYVGTVGKTATDNIGNLTFTVKSTQAGDNERLIIHVDPARRQPLPAIQYQTLNV